MALALNDERGKQHVGDGADFCICLAGIRGRGAIAETHQRKDLAETIKMALFNQEKNAVWKNNLKLAAKELCWENEEVILQEIYKPFLLENS